MSITHDSIRSFCSDSDRRSIACPVVRCDRVPPPINSSSARHAASIGSPHALVLRHRWLAHHGGRVAAIRWLEFPWPRTPRRAARRAPQVPSAAWEALMCTAYSTRCAKRRGDREANPLTRQPYRQRLRRRRCVRGQVRRRKPVRRRSREEPCKPPKKDSWPSAALAKNRGESSDLRS